MDNIDDIKFLEEEIVKLEYDLKQLRQGLNENSDKVKKVESKLQAPYSVSVNLIMTFFSVAITGAFVFLLLKWWISTDFSILTGLLLLVVAVISLIWDITAIITSTRKHHNKSLAEYQKIMDTLLQEKEEMIANRYAIKNKIKETKDAINNIKLLQISEVEEKKRKAEGEEREREAELEARFQEIISNEKVDKNELKTIADSGHDKAKIEIAKLLIEDYFSDIYTESEKKKIIDDARDYIIDFKNKDDEHEFIFLFCDSVVYGNLKYTLEDNLKRIQEIKNAGSLSEKYDKMADRVIPQIEKQLDELKRKELEKQRAQNKGSSYSYSTKSYSSSSQLCAYYNYGCCTHGYNSFYKIKCDYSECFHSVCPNYKRR